jgi:small subunit ribosomal protein S9
LTEEEEKKTVPDNPFFWGTGRRKSAVARVRLRPGQGMIVVNGKEFQQYFTDTEARIAVESPLRAVDAADGFEVRVNVTGGGFTGQAGAIRLGIARALGKVEKTYADTLKAGGFLTRDSRMKERKKYGLRGARRAFQFSKR